jgi:putative membrane protein
MTDHEEPATAKLDASTRLAVERTRLAHDRTLLAWVRTAIALITFGFGIYKVVESGNSSSSRRFGPREFGMIMIGAGLLALLFGTREHRTDLLQLQAEYPGATHRSSARVIAALIGVLGMLAFLAMLLRQ